MTRKLYRYINSHAVHCTFLLILLAISYSRQPQQGVSAVVAYAAILLLYLWMVWLSASRWSKRRYIKAAAAIAGLILIVRITQAAYLDYTVLWPLLYVLAVSERKWAGTTNLLTVLTGLGMVVMMLFDGFSYGALITSFLIYAAVRSQSLLQNAYQTNRLQFRQLERTYAELQTASVRSMEYAALTERTRLAREIHDGLGHQMTSMIVQLQALRLMIPSDPLVATEQVTELLQVARKGMEEIRYAVKDWSDDEKGLGLIALRGLVHQTEGNSRIRIAYKESGDFTAWAVENSVILYRILQEALTNVLKHSGSDNVNVLVEEHHGSVKLTVEDDGNFHSIKTLELGFGLTAMIDRCKAVGGSCIFSAKNPHGFRVEVDIPLASLRNGELEESHANG